MNILALIVLVTAGSDQIDGAIVVGVTDSMESCAARVTLVERENADLIARFAANGIVPVAVCEKVGVAPELPKTKLPPRADDTPT